MEDEALPQLPFPIAFLQLSTYLNCPLQFYRRFVAKDVPREVKSSQQTSGINVHDALKRRIKLREPLPAEFELHEPLCQAIEADKESICDVELSLGCTRHGHPVGFFDADVALRCKLDLVLIRPDTGLACIIDWKTGKPWDDPLELKLQALLLRINRPEITQVKAFYVWLRTHKNGVVYEGEALNPALIFEQVRRHMMGMAFRITNNDWPPDENPLCPWCPVTKQQCKYKKEKP